MKKKIIFICWVSWSWKSTIINALLKTNRFIYFPSYSTRIMRPWEINWERYNFITVNEFKESIKKKEFLEYNIYCGNYYGTKKDIISPINWEKIPIKESDLSWLSKIIKWHQIDNKFISIFLSIPAKIQIERIKKRWAPITDEELEKRLKLGEKERTLAKKICNHILNLDNHSEKENINKVLDTLKKEKIL